MDLSGNATLTTDSAGQMTDDIPGLIGDLWLEEPRKRQIVLGAIAAFMNKGYAGTSMNDIVAWSGLSKGGVYHYFANKDEIIMGLLQGISSQSLNNAASEQLSPQLGTRETVIRTVMSVAELISSNSAMAALEPVWMDFQGMANRNARIRAVLLTSYKSQKERLAEIIQEGVARGELKPVVAADAATAIIALCDGLRLAAAIDPELSLTRALETAINTYLDGITA